MVEHFIPISLCYVVHKIITKILSYRLRPLLDQMVSPFKSAFISSHYMSDSVTINHKIMHHINLKKGNLKLVVVKIDLTKAYDKGK